MATEGGGRRICVPVDSSSSSHRAMRWVASNMATPRDTISLLCVQDVLSDPFATEIAATPFSDVSGTHMPNEMTRPSERNPAADEACSRTLQEFQRSALQAGIRETQLRLAQIEPGGGASGVGESIVRFAEKTGQDVVVLGSRGMGAVKRTMYSLIGLGSVSSFAVNHLHCAVVVVKPPERGTGPTTAGAAGTKNKPP